MENHPPLDIKHKATAVDGNVPHGSSDKLTTGSGTVTLSGDVSVADDKSLRMTCTGTGMSAMPLEEIVQLQKTVGGLKSWIKVVSDGI